MKILMWEYSLKVLDRQYSHSEVVLKLNQLGKEGWEFSSVVIIGAKTYYLFKRPCGYVEDDV